MIELFKLLGHAADHLKRLIALVSVLVLFTGINQSTITFYHIIHEKGKTLNQTESGSREAHFFDHGSEVLVMV